MSTAKKLKYYNKGEASGALEIVRMLYYNFDEVYKDEKNEYFVRVLSKKDNEYKAYNIQSITDPIKLRNILNKFGKEDVMMSLNGFTNMHSAKREDLFCINAIAVDIDYKNDSMLKDLDTWQVVGLLEESVFDKMGTGIPKPNLIEHGNQLRLIYLVESCYVPKKSKAVVRLADKVADVFATRLKEYGAEKQNLESYVRVSGSVNRRNGAVVRYEIYEDVTRNSLRDIQDMWLEDVVTKIKKGKRKVTKQQVFKIHNLYVLNTNRLRDFEKIQGYLNLNGINDFKVRLCFLYRNFTLLQLRCNKEKLDKRDFEYAEQKMLEFNRNFNSPLREKDIISSTNNVNRNQYLYKSLTLMDYLELDEAMCESLGLEGIYTPKTQKEWNKDYYDKNRDEIIEKNSSVIKENYQKKLKEEGKLTEKEMIAERRVKIKDLLAEGLKRKDILSTLDISIPTYERDRKFLKEQGLI